ncbi:MAG TPA: gingipain R, partial [Candidatus Cloacimonadota bacterium]|nr:gingipain R [Candidatus Cloacimonadota bacterium]
TTADPYLSVVTPQELTPSIPANAFGSTVNGIQIAIANNVPNQHVAEYTVVVTLDDESVYTSNRSITINAPELSFGVIMVDDVDGNDNGRIDPGELFTISIPFTNSGNATALALHGTIMVSGGEHLIFPILNDFAVVPQGSGFELVNQIALSSQIPAGTTIQITAMITFGDYLALHNYNIVVGIIAEDFESGFTNFPWGFTNGDWTISDGGYNNTSAAKSPAIGNSQATSMSITLSNASDGIISFWKKVSSEAGYDYLRFYINGQMKNQWSGIDPYFTQASYMVAAGTNTYKWEYYKDGGGFAGADCAWVDDVVFPAAEQFNGAPVFHVNATSLDFGNACPSESTTQNITVSNLGNATMMGTLQLPEPYTLGDPEGETLGLLSYILAPGTSQEYTITFRPAEEGVFAAYLRISSDDPNA